MKKKTSIVLEIPNPFIDTDLNDLSARPQRLDRLV